MSDIVINIEDQQPAETITIKVDPGATSGSLPFEQNNVGRYIPFGDIYLGYIPDMPETITIDEMTAYLNQRLIPLTITQTQTPILLSGVRNSKLYMFAFIGGKGVWGTAGGGSTIPIKTIVAIQVFSLTTESISNGYQGAVIIALGDLPSGNYVGAINATGQQDFSNAGSFNADGYPITYYLSYIQNEVLYIVQFKGAPGIYNGNFVANDFSVITDSNVSPDLDIASQGDAELAATAADLNTIDDSKVSTPRALRWFWNKVRSLSWPWSDKQLFNGGIQLGGLTANYWIKLNGDKDVISFDGQALLNGKVDKGDVVVTLAEGQTNVNTNAAWQDRTVKFVTGGTDFTITLNDDVTFMGVKSGTGIITFVNGIKTAEFVNGITQVDGVQGSMFLLMKRESAPNKVNLYINNL